MTFAAASPGRSPDRGTAATARGGLAAVALRWLPFMGILVAALLLRVAVGGVTDVSWQITLCEKILAGQRLYVDLLEVNPPASTFLYLPGVALAQYLGLSPDLVIDLQALAAACLSVFVTGRILARSPLSEIATRSTALVALAVLTLLPMRTFAQREHFALIAILPFLAVAASRAAGALPPLWHGAVAGFGAGVTLCIKPHFALVVVFCEAVAVVRARSLRPLFGIENWVAGGLVALYAAVVLVLYPQFLTDMMPLLADVYLPVRRPFGDIVVLAPVLLWLLGFVVIGLLDRHVRRSIAFQIAGAAGLGFAIAYLVQGKGWPYQALPLLGLAVLGFKIAWCGGEASLRPGIARLAELALIAAGALVAAGSAFWLYMGIDARAVAAEVARLADRPSIVIISGDIAYGHPLVRDVGGRWISAVCALWINDNAVALEKAGLITPANRDRIAAHVAQDRRRLIADLRDARPDIVLVDKEDPAWWRWAANDPEVAAQLRRYTERSTVDGITIYQRDPAS